MLFMRRRRNEAVPEVGAEAPEFNLPSAQGGQLRLSMRTARGPVVVVFFRGAWFEEDVEYFRTLAAKEDEINLSGASIVGIGALEPDEAREFARESGTASMPAPPSSSWGRTTRSSTPGPTVSPRWRRSRRR